MRGTDMLLQEGMNVKVLLLPDGDDPDSFSRKHTAEEFRKYIDDHQTDFIQFKTDLLLKGVNDPLRRAEAINSIVRSVSVIPDSIVRSTYLTDCSRRLGVDERTLITQTNKFIAQEREKPTTERPQDVQAPDAQTTSANDVAFAVQVNATAEVERLLRQQVVRHGEEIIFDDLEIEDGQTVSMNVAQYVDYEFVPKPISPSIPM